jgi:hypothetical protein
MNTIACCIATALATSLITWFFTVTRGSCERAYRAGYERGIRQAKALLTDIPEHELV